MLKVSGDKDLLLSFTVTQAYIIRSLYITIFVPHVHLSLSTHETEVRHYLLVIFNGTNYSKVHTLLIGQLVAPSLSTHETEYIRSL
jgi:hypothetical protein